MVKWNPDNKWLQLKFKLFNKRYFDGELPKETLVIWRKPFEEGHAAEFVEFQDGRLLILLNPVLKKIGAESFSLLSLLHEMCHLSLWYQGKRKSVYTGHGVPFQAEMLTLANKGAFSGLW